MNKIKCDNWPELPYEKFASTAHLLHMCAQVLGKLKLHTPFEPHWANVPLWLNCRGLSTGMIPYHNGAFSLEMDLINQKIRGENTEGKTWNFNLRSMSVAELTQHIFHYLKSMDIHLTINPKPQEVPNPILFHEDTQERSYHGELALTWWRILVNTSLVLQKYHARFRGITPNVGLMWGTFDLRDARYKGISIPTTGPNAGYIRRNAMDDAQVEVGFWHGNEAYPKPAYFSFTYPKPDGLEKASIEPNEARWNDKLGEFILDYEDIRRSPHPEKDLLAFFTSTYEAGAKMARWDSKLIGSEKAV